MYQAEIRGKISSDLENKEDILTSNVFSFFKYSNRKAFLLEFLNLVNIEISEEEAKKAIFNFWPSYDDNTEPDLVLIVGDYYILVEAKYLSGFGQETENIQHQLVREYEGGKAAAEQLKKKFILLTITADPFYKPYKFTGVPTSILDCIRWVNWQAITILIENILSRNPEISEETLAFAEDLFVLLQKKGLRSFIGIERLIPNHDITQVAGDLFFDLDTVNYRGSFSGFQALILSQMIDYFTVPIFFGSQARLFETLDQPEEIGVVKQEVFWRQ